MTKKIMNGLDLQSQRITSLGDPSASTDAATKNYVDNVAAGLAWKQSVRCATTATGTLATAYANGQTVDGITLVTGDRILIKNQSSGQENGIYLVAASGAPARSSDANTQAKLSQATVFVAQGTVNADKSYTQTVDTITVDTTPLVWVQVGGGNLYVAGNGLTGTGTFSVLANGSSIDVSGSGVKIADAAGGNGLTVASGIMAVGAGTGISVAADTVAIDTSVVPRKYAVTIGDGVTTAIVITHSLGTRDVMIAVYDAATFETVLVDEVRTTTNTCTLTFAVAPSSSAYRVVVLG